MKIFTAVHQCSRNFNHLLSDWSMWSITVTLNPRSVVQLQNVKNKKKEIPIPSIDATRVLKASIGRDRFLTTSTPTSINREISNSFPTIPSHRGIPTFISQCGIPPMSLLLFFSLISSVKLLRQFQQDTGGVRSFRI